MRLIADWLGVLVSLVLAYSIKFKVAQFSLYVLKYQIGQVYQHAQIEPYLAAYWFVLLIVMGSFFVFQGYQSRRGFLAGIDECVVVIKAMSLSILLIVTFNFVTQIIPSSRGVFVNFWLVAIVVLSCFRMAIIRIERFHLLVGLV